MKRKITSLLTLTVTCMILIVACKKNEANSEDTAANLQVQSDDQARVSGELDAVANDANMILNDPSLDAQFSFNSPVAAGNTSPNNIICDASLVVDTVSNPRTITVTYDGTNCAGNRTRTGAVVLSMPKGMHWGDQGAVLTVSVQNLKIKRLGDNKSITLNGTKTITNVSGGKLINLASLGSITHTLSSSNMSITFDNGTQRSWQVAAQREFTYDNGVVISTTGMHTDGTNQGIVEWGVNRFGKTFACSISEPVVVRQDCDFRVVSGEIKHIRGDVTTTTTFGLDVNGNATACPGFGFHYFFKIAWTFPAGATYSFILPY